jgi:hypothetical protein
MIQQPLSTNSKALRINLDSSNYGTIAEIGGGQEVSRKFFQAGGASGTIAKTISAYDKSFSDKLYNKGIPGRYVSENRVDKMLHQEYSEITSLLQKSEDKKTRYFAFANTVTTLNYKKDNHSHGWIGMRFQLKANSEPNYVVMHVQLNENESLLQQMTLGILGVNLIYACYYYNDKPEVFLRSLMDNLDADRVNITMIRMSGPELNYIDNRLLAVQLVKNGMTEAIMFDRYGNVQEPMDMLYKKNILVFRGSFRPATYVTTDMLRASYSIFKRDPDYDKHKTIGLCEMTLKNLLEDGKLDERDFLDRVDILNRLGQNVMVSRYSEHYKLIEYLSGFRTTNIRIVMGILTFIKVMDKQYYQELKGGILEAMGKLFCDNMKLYIYPALKANKKELLTIHDVELSSEMEFLIKYLRENRKLLDITDARKKFLEIFPNQVIENIKSNNKDWEEMVPNCVVNIIKKKNLLGYKES